MPQGCKIARAARSDTPSSSEGLLLVAGSVAEKDSAKESGSNLGMCHVAGAPCAASKPRT